MMLQDKISSLHAAQNFPSSWQAPGAWLSILRVIQGRLTNSEFG